MPAKIPLPKSELALYEKLIKSIPELELRTGFGFPYTAINGHMFSFMAKTGSVGIRLPKKERAYYLEKFKTTLFQNHKGPVLKEYVQIPDAILKNTDVLIPLLECSLTYVKTLKPKPAKKKK